MRRIVQMAVPCAGILLLVGIVWSQETEPRPPVILEHLPVMEFFPNAPQPEGLAASRKAVFLTTAGAIVKTDELGNLLQRLTTSGKVIGVSPLTNGNVICTDATQGAILEVMSNGFFRVIAHEFDGARFTRPTELVSHRDGRVYFTDPGDPMSVRAMGRVFLVHPGGKVELFAEDLRNPTGLVLSLNGKELFVAETGSGIIHRFPLKPEGTASERITFAKLKPEGTGPRGMKFDENGNLWVAHYGKGVIAAINPDGRIVREISAGGRLPTNVAFWKSSLLVSEAEKKRVVRIELGIRGAKLPAG